MPVVLSRAAPVNGAIDAALARRKILFAAADFRHDAAARSWQAVELARTRTAQSGRYGKSGKGRGAVRSSGTDLPRRAGDTARFFRKAVMRHMVVGRIALPGLEIENAGYSHGQTLRPLGPSLEIPSGSLLRILSVPFTVCRFSLQKPNCTFDRSF